MNMDSLRSALRAQLESRLKSAAVADPAHDLAHVDRVWANVCQIAAGENRLPGPALLAATYLHDLVNLPKDHPDRASAAAQSAEAAGPIMADLGLYAAQIAEAKHAILSHSYSGDTAPETVDAAILRDADRLDSLGAMGLARTFSVGGQLGRPLMHPTDPFAKDRALDDQAWTVDHFATKLLKLPEGMLTATGRNLAERRARILRSWLDLAAQEMGVPASDW